VSQQSACRARDTPNPAKRWKSVPSPSVCHDALARPRTIAQRPGRASKLAPVDEHGVETGVPEHSFAERLPIAARVAVDNAPDRAVRDAFDHVGAHAALNAAGVYRRPGGAGSPTIRLAVQSYEF